MYCKRMQVFGQSRAAHREAAIRNRISIRAAICARHFPAGRALSGWCGGTKAGSRSRIRSIRAPHRTPDAGRIGAGRRVSLGRWLAGTARSEAYARLQRGEVISARLQTADPSGRFLHARRSDSSLGGDDFHSGSFVGAGARGGAGLRPPCRVLQAGSRAIEDGRTQPATITKSITV